MTPKPEVLNLLEKLQNFTPDEVDEERGSFKIGDSIIYDMLGGALGNSDLIKTLGIKEHTLRISHNEAIAKIAEIAGEEVSRYTIVFEDGFTIKDVATSELKAPEPSGIQPEPQEEPNLNAEELHLEDYSKDDLEKVKSKSVKTGDAIRKVEDDELKIAPDRVKVKKESKIDEGIKDVVGVYVEQVTQNRWDVVLQDKHGDDDSVKQFGEDVDARKKANQLAIAFGVPYNGVRYLKKESKTNEVEEGELKVGDRVKDNESHTGTVQKAPIDPLDLDKVLVEYDDTGARVTVHVSKLEKIPEAKTDEQVIREEKCPKCDSENFTESNEAGDYACADCGYDESIDESKLNEDLEASITTLVQNELLNDPDISKDVLFQNVLEGVKDEVREEVKQLLPQIYNDVISHYFESKLKEETEITPSRAEFKKIGDNQLRKLYKNVCRSCDYYKKDKTQPEKVEACEKAMKQYEEEMRARGLIESKFSFMSKQKPLWLCNECYKTFRNAEAICVLCESKEVERILDEQSKEVFQVTWKDEKTGEEETTRIMAFDKADVNLLANRKRKELLKVEGPITEEPRKEEAKVPFDENLEGSNFSELEDIVDGILQDKYPGMGVAEVLDALVGQHGPLTSEERTKIKVYIADVIDENLKEKWEHNFIVTWQMLDEPEIRKLPINADSKSHAGTRAKAMLVRDGIPEKSFEIKSIELEEREQKVIEDEPITAIEIVTSKIDPDAYNIRVVQIPEGSIVILDSVSDRAVAIERGKKFAQDLNAKFLGIIDEKKVDESMSYEEALKIAKQPEDYMKDQISSAYQAISNEEITDENREEIKKALSNLGYVISRKESKLKEQEDIFKMSDEELEKLPLHDLGRARETAWQNYRLGSGIKGGMDWKESWRRLDTVIKKMGESKLKEQEEDTFSTAAKGIANKEIADKLAVEEEGQVVVDDEDDKKFAVLVKKDV